MLFRYSDAYHIIVNAAGAAASVPIEVLQCCETVWGFSDVPKISDINDVALNTAGAAIGWLVFRLFEPD